MKIRLNPADLVQHVGKEASAREATRAIDEAHRNGTPQMKLGGEWASLPARRTVYWTDWEATTLISN